MQKVLITVTAICSAHFSIAGFAQVDFSIANSEIISCERIRFLALSKSKSSHQTLEPKQLDLVIDDENGAIFFRQGDLLWHTEPTIKNDNYEMVSEHFWFDKQTKELSFVVRGPPNRTTSFRWYKCH